MENDNEKIIPQKKSLFPLSPDDIVDNALQNLDEKQAAEVTKKLPKKSSESLSKKEKRNIETTPRKRKCKISSVTPIY